MEAAKQMELAPTGTTAEVRDMSGGLLEVIAKAARDPNVDIDKMERLLEMQERVQARNAKSEFTRAMAQMQTVLPEIAERGAIKNNNKQVQSTYALWEDINETIKPILSEHGFALSFRTRLNEGVTSVVGILSHVDGHSEEAEMALPSDTSGSKNAVQAVGSSTSYAKRYIAQALLNLTSRGEDDDGRAAGAGKAVDDGQLALLQGLAGAVNADLARFCRLFRVDSLKDIPTSRYDEAVSKLRSKAPADADLFLKGAA